MCLQPVRKCVVTYYCRAILLGPASSGELSPFEAELSDESEEKKISDAIAHKKRLAVGKSTLHGPAPIHLQLGNFRSIMKLPMPVVHKSMHPLNQQ